jgi:hypothetical protein
MPHPVDRATHEVTLDVLHNALNRARVDGSERIPALKRLVGFARQPLLLRSSRHEPGALNSIRSRLGLNVPCAPMLHSPVTARRRAA